jgi:hypothetical protein
MRIPFIFYGALLLAVGVSAQSLQMVNVNYPGIYCRFDPNCTVSADEQSDSITTSNGTATCVLMSRSFPGTSLDTEGRYGYEYQVTINGNGQTTETNILAVDSLSLTFGKADYFSFSQRASNQVWVVTAGGPTGVAPGSANLDGKNVTISFDPPLTLNTLTDQSANTVVFGMMSDGAPKLTTATLLGSTEDPVHGKLSFKLKLRAQCPGQ